MDMAGDKYRDEDIDLSELSEEDAQWAIEALLGYEPRRINNDSLSRLS